MTQPWNTRVAGLNHVGFEPEGVPPYEPPDMMSQSPLPDDEPSVP